MSHLPPSSTEDWDSSTSRSPPSSNGAHSEGSSGKINAGAFWKQRNINNPATRSLPSVPLPVESSAPGSPIVTLGHSPHLSSAELYPSFDLPPHQPQQQRQQQQQQQNHRMLPSPSSSSQLQSFSKSHSHSQSPSGKHIIESTSSSSSAGSSYASSSFDQNNQQPRTRQTSDETISSASSSSPQQPHDQQLGLSLLAGQAALDVDQDSYHILSWEEVESLKKELGLVVDRLNVLKLRFEREQKILTAARTLDRLHVGHKRMSKQTTEELQTAEKRSASAEKDMYVIMERETQLRRRLNEHYASALAWETRRLRAFGTQSSPMLASMSEKGRDREKSLADQVERLERTVFQVKESLSHAQDKETGLTEQLKRANQTFEAERMQVRDHEESKARLEETARRLELSLEEKTKEVEQLGRPVGTASTILGPLISSRSTNRDVSTQGKPIDSIAQLVKDEFLSLESRVEEGIAELQAVRQKTETERATLEQERVTERRRVDEMKKRWDEERETLKAKIANLANQATQTKSVESTVSIEQETTLAHIQNLWSLLPSRSNTALFPFTPNPSSTPFFASPSLPDSSTIPNQSPSLSNTGSSALAPSSLSRTLGPALPSPALSSSSSLSQTQDLSALVASYNQTNGSTPYPGIEVFSDRVRALIEDGRMLVERTAKLKRERDIHKSNSERAQRLVMESKAGLETYQRQVRMLEDRLASVEHDGRGVDHQNFQKYNELEGNITSLKEDKQRLESSLAAQIEACESLSEANEALSARAMTVANQASQEKRVVQQRLESEIDKLRVQLDKTQDDLDDYRAKEMQGPGIALLDEVNSLQDEVQKLRAQLRAAQAGKL